VPNSIALGGVPLVVGETVEWPLARGFSPSAVTFQQPLAMLGRLSAIPFETELTLVAHGVTVSIPVLRAEVAPASDDTCLVTLSDARYLLARAFWPGDFNVRILDDQRIEPHDGSGAAAAALIKEGVKQPQYLVDTSADQGPTVSTPDTPHTIRTAIQRIRGIVSGSFGFDPFAGDATATIPATVLDTVVPDNALVGGMTIPAALAALLDPVGCDLVNAADGSLRFATRDAADLPDTLSGARWETIPPWAAGPTSRKGVPATVRTPFARRVAITATNEYSRKSAPAGAMLVYLEQMYEGIGDSGYVDLAQLIASQSALMGARAASVGDALIAQHIVGRRGWADTILQQYENPDGDLVAGLDESTRVKHAKAIVSRIQTDWLRVFRFNFPSGQIGAADQNLPNYGALTDIVFGRLRDADTVAALGAAAGTVRVEAESLNDAAWIDPARAVTCAWADLYTKWVDGPGGAVVEAVFFTSAAANNARDANKPTPFVPDWLDMRRGVFRLSERAAENIWARIPGALVSTRAYVDFDANEFAGKLQRSPKFMERSLEFQSGVPLISVEFVATVRHPQDLSRWYVVDSDVSGGDYTTPFFLASEADNYAYFVGTNATPVNQPQLEANARKRTDRYIGAMRARKSGVGFAHGLTAHGVVPDGLIDSVTYRWSPPATIDMVINVGAGDVAKAETRRRDAANAADVARRKANGVAKPT
jgi:hypothetical protein